MKRYIKVLISIAVLALAALPAFSQQLNKHSPIDNKHSEPKPNYCLTIDCNKKLLHHIF